MEDKLKKLFDYQRFEKNPKLERMIEKAEAGCRQLPDENLEGLNAAGSSVPINPKELEKFTGKDLFAMINKSGNNRN